jgi:hypothetical protein
MANILQENKVIYIEPNAIDGMTLPNDSTDGSYVYKTPNEEDMCTVVDLEVELKGRTYNGSTDGNSENIQMEWQSSTTGQTINFMKGSKIYTDSSKTSYINSLTTSYTDIYLKDIQNHGTAEMFGIKSIDIAYNNFMIPEVTIQFVDVRGVSLFAQEEMRHNIVRDGISATANPDIEGSFFKAFFSFPYPKFTLKVKGFYGKMVAYELSCTDFRAEFDSNAGNFNVTAKFLGYGFSFLNDLTVNALVAAPYCEYDGKKYWEDNLGTRFKVTDKNGAEVSMVKLGDIVKKFNEIQQSVNQALQEEGYIEPKPGATSTTNTSGNTSGETKDTRSADITQLKADYEALIQKLHQIKPPSPKNGDCMIRVEGSNSFCLITNYDNKEIEGYREAINILNNNIDKYNVKELIEWKKKNNSNTNGGLRLLKFDDYIGEEEEKLTDDAKNIYEDFYNQEKNKYSSVIIENGLKNAITTKGNSKIKSDSDKTYAGLWSNCDASTVYVYQDLGLKDILAGASKEKEAEEVDKTVDERATELMVEKFAETFDFVPSLENITKVIMAHVETYIHMISSCAESIISKGNARSVSSLGVSLDSFPDAKGNSSTSSNENVVIAPFPKVTTVVTQEGIEKTEDAWLGSLSDGTKFEEVSLVEGLLKGVENVGKEFSIQAAIDSGQAIGEDISSNLVKPLSYLDLFMGEDDNPFGKDIDIKNIYNVLAHFAVRCFSLYASSNDLTNGDNKTEIFKTFGNLDSENFLNIYKSNPNLEGLKEALQSDKTASDYFKYLTESTDGCWYTKHALLKENHYTYGYYYHLNLCQINGGCSVAVKNWSFKEWKRDSNSVLKKTETPSYILTCTPLLGGKYQTNIYRDDSNAFYIKENAVPYIKNVMQSIENDQNIGISLDDLKKETTFDSGTCADNFGLWGKTTIDMSTAGGIYSTSMEGQNAKCGDIGVTWDENGNVTINDQLTGKFLEHVFLNEDYYITDNGIRTKEERAEYFLRRFFQQYTDKKEEERLSIEKALSIRQFDIYKNFAFKAKIELLYHGMLCYKYKTFGTLKPEIYNKLAKFYKTWLENNFAKIDANFAFKFKRNNKENITKAFKDIQSVLTKNTSAIQTKILEYVDASQFTKNYTANTGGWIRDSIKANSTPELTALLQDLFKIYAVSIPTRYYENKRETTNSGQKTLIEIPYDNIKGYIEGVLQGLKERLGVISDGSTSDSVTTTLNLGGSNEDIKVGLYNHIKMLYDKWISSGHSIKEFTMEKMFYDEDHTFHFVDSFYNKIGKTIFLNVGSLANRVQASMSQSGYNLLSFLSDIYSQNKLLLLCLQNFMDLSKKENMSTMFKPIPYYEMEEPDNHPDIVVMYAYEASSKLDIEGSDYPDDTFYLNESTTWPSMITSKQASDLALPAFGVSYGQQYQHFFKNIEVSMNAPIVTEQSIKAQYQICGAGGNDENNGSRQTTIGQDLYTIYSNNSYTCTVTMMGCAWVQPMMYFVLMNVPMFRGSYQIIKVRHNLTPGNMTTTFTGVRMAKTATRTVKEFIAGGYNDSWGGSDMERFMNQNANIGNDCPWAYNSPINVEPSCGAQQSTSDNKSIDEYMSGLTSAIQASLTTSEVYSRVTVSMEKRKDNWMLLTAKGTNANNAMFDCILQTYGDWFDKLSWGCNNGAVSGDAYGIHVHVVTKAPSSHEIYIYSKDQTKTISVTKAEEINDSLKKSMIKFYRKSSIKNASKAKAIFKSITSMDDTTVTNIFELNCD